MMKRICFLLITVFAFIFGAFSAGSVLAAHPDAIDAAIESIGSFYTDSDAFTKDFVSEGFRLASVSAKDAAVKEIKSVEWTEEPSQRRGQRLRSIVEGYMRGRINGIEKELAARRPKEGPEGLLLRLGKLRDDILSRLEEALKSEARDKKEIKPVPIMDRPPQETPAPGDEPGIWYR